MREARKPNQAESYITPDGRLTLDGQKLFQNWVEAMREAKTALDGVAAVSDPTGGGTIDAEARTAIIAIIDAAS